MATQLRRQRADAPSPSLHAAFADVAWFGAVRHGLASLSLAWRGLPGEVASQLERALVSVVLNIAEGAGRWTPADQRRHYRIARGSALEAAACLDIAAIMGAPANAVGAVADPLGQATRILNVLSRPR